MKRKVIGYSLVCTGEYGYEKTFTVRHGLAVIDAAIKVAGRLGPERKVAAIIAVHTMLDIGMGEAKAFVEDACS